MATLLDAPGAYYTPITTSGTTTVAPKASVYQGIWCYVLATATDVITVLDGTSTLVTGTVTALGAQLTPTNFCGMRIQNSLIVITTGTAANSYNVLWD